MAHINIKNKTICVILFLLAQLTIFWLGRFSAQITQLENDLIAKRSHESKELVKGPDVENADKSPTYLLIAIMSAPQDFVHRQVIRETWLRLSTKTPELYRYIFPVGTKELNATELSELYDEQLRNYRNGAPDIVLFDDLTEEYQKLARKTAAVMHYAVEQFKFEFFLKVDADSFVRLGKLLGALRDVAHPRLYWGFLDGRAKPFRKGKWKEPEWILCDRYLPYQLGGGYVLSYSLVDYVSRNRHLLRYYGSEDVAVGAWIAGLEVKYVHDPRFDTEFTSRGCHNEYLITHKQSAESMREYFENIRNIGLLCRTEQRTRFSYIYDFSVPPSQCCTRRNDSAVP